jgi:hypothetical protein
VDSARQNLASTLVNAFVNAGFGTDKMVTPSSEGSGGDNGGRAGTPGTVREDSRECSGGSGFQHWWY